MTSEQVLLQLDNVHISSHLDNRSFRLRRTQPRIPSDRIAYYLHMAGFYNVTFLHGYKLVPGLITALIERWRPETHTFHFPFGECTITLQDVAIQLGVPINGNAVVGHDSYNVVQLCDHLLGKIPYGSDVRGSRVKLSWLDNEFKVTENSTEQEVKSAARAYMLHTIGGILMPDKSGNFVHIQYLPLLANFRETRNYSWGSAILSLLYHEMCKAAILKDNNKISDIGGCLTLLQSWAWYRLPYLTPITKAPIEFPLAGRWRHDMKKAGVVHNNVVDVRLMIESIGKNQFIWTPYDYQEVMSCVPPNVWENSSFWGAIVPLINFSIVEYQCADRVLRQFNFVQPIPKPPIDIEHIHHRGLSDEEEAFAINLWNNRFDWLPEDCTPIEGNNFNCSPEYTEWFNNNGKPFLVAHEVSQRWHTEQRCSYQHVGETFEPEQNWHQSPNNGVMDLNIEWSTWESRTEPIRPVVGSSSSSNPWEEPIYNYPTVGETTYQHTQVSSSEPRNVFEQPHVQTNFGASSSSYACHDDDVYRPQFDYPQPSTYGQSMCVDSVTCWLSTTTISTPSFAQDMYSTPPPMQTMDDQLNQDEQTPDLLHQRRIVNPPRRYDQTSSLHRQVLPRRKG